MAGNSDHASALYGDPEVHQRGPVGLNRRQTTQRACDIGEFPPHKRVPA